MATTKTKVTNNDALPLEAQVIQCIRDFKAPKTTQDALDRACAEYLVANMLRQQADKRYEYAKKTIVEAHEVDIAKVRNAAVQLMQKSSTLIKGGEWVLTIAANKPATKVDADELRTQLVKMGVKAELIDEAITLVEKKLTPALNITVNKE